MQNPNYNQFRVGQTIHCRSVPHLLDRDFPLVSLEIKLDTAAKQITLGTTAKQTLTKIYKESQSESGDAGGESGEEDPGGGGMDTDAMEERLAGIEERISALEDTLAGLNTDGWIHQVNGLEMSSGIVNFVTDT